jgi:S-adenosylmethionine:tRNA ribosyltransferase-isomerase
MKTSEFDYVLPPELIAQHPIEPRDASRLLVVDRRTGALEHRTFRDLSAYLRAGDLLVGNDSRVIPARLHGVKSTGGAVEIFLLHPEQGYPAASAWECLVGGKGLRAGAEVTIKAPAVPYAVKARILAETPAGGRVVRFDPPVEDWLWNVGEVPLPPYVHAALDDDERYQTVYSRIEGSVASSTAGLHFTPELLLGLRAQGINLVFVTLHIGLDTFRPVQTEEIENHQIHHEWAELSADTARAVNETRLAGGRVFAIGTTAVRVLESAAKIALGFRPCDDVPVGTVCGWQTVAAFQGETDLFIRPSHQFRAVNAMITNFHLPRSTLLMLVGAFAGKELIDRAYDEAIREGYRFYSFGDAMLIL